MDPCLLLVDDEAGILDMLELVLRKEGYANIVRACSGEEALRLLGECHPQLIVLDVMLPDINGFELCGRLRRESDIPVLFLTAKTMDYEKLAGFAIGGDDYITKPFNPLEVVARIKVQLRHRRMGQDGEQSRMVRYEDFTINKDTCEVTVRHELVAFTAMEYSLLLFFAEHPNRVFTAAQLYEQVWGQMHTGDEKTVVMHISKIRKKLEPDAERPKYIRNLRGLGYKFIPCR